MATITVYGASDDLLEIDGDFLLEADCYDAPAIPIHVNGTHLLTIEYGRDGLWRIHAVDVPAEFEVVRVASATADRNLNPPRHPAPHADKPAYSDVFTVIGPIETVEAYGQTAIARTDLPTRP